MGLSLSLLFSAWQEIATHNLFSLVFGVQFLGESENKQMALRSNSFSKAEVATLTTSMTTARSNKTNSKNSIKLASEPVKLILQSSLSFKDLVQDSKKPDSTKLNSAISLPDPAIMFSPRPLHELDAAAVTVQKVYKSYRTRRNLADCAVVAEELWWKAMDFVALNRSSVSFFNEEKHETAISRWARARTRAAKVGKGLSKDEKAQKLALQHWLEAIDPRHRYGHNLHFYYDKWFQSESCQPFFYWLDVGDGKEMNLEKCSRSNLQKQCIKYLGPKEREEYEVVIENGKLVFKQSGALVETVEGSKWIFVLSTTRNLYVAQKKKGKFQHSSFLAGGAITAAGRLVAHGGILEAIWPYSGHYLPTEENFREFISFLDVHKVDLLNVKRCATDDDTPPSNIPRTQSDSSLKKLEETSTSSTELETTATENKPAYSLSQRMSRKWTTGTGPRIGCVREYPSEVQFQALERVNLSPRVPYGSMVNYGPIPSPRPSPKVRLSPRVSYIGMQSPRTPIAAAG